MTVDGMIPGVHHAGLTHMPRVHAGHVRLVEEGEPTRTSELIVQRKKSWRTKKVKRMKMDYLNLEPKELALMLLYAAEVGHVDPELAREAAHRIYPDIAKESIEQRAERYMQMLRSETATKIQAIKQYRNETGCSLKDAKDYIDGLEEKMHRTGVPHVMTGYDPEGLCKCPVGPGRAPVHCPIHGFSERTDG